MSTFIDICEVGPRDGLQIEAVATTSDGYLVNSRDNTVEAIAAPGRPAAEPVKVPEGIAATVSSGDSVWVLTSRGDVADTRTSLVYEHHRKHVLEFLDD